MKPIKSFGTSDRRSGVPATVKSMGLDVAAVKIVHAATLSSAAADVRVQVGFSWMSAGWLLMLRQPWLAP